MAKRSRGAPGMHELEPGLYKVVVSLGRDSPGRYRQHARTVPAERATSENLEVPLGGLLPSRYARRSQATVRSGSPSLIYLGGRSRPYGPLWHSARRGAGHGLVTVQGSRPARASALRDRHRRLECDGLGNLLRRYRAASENGAALAAFAAEARAILCPR